MNPGQTLRECLAARLDADALGPGRARALAHGDVVMVARYEIEGLSHPGLPDPMAHGHYLLVGDVGLVGIGGA